MAMAHAAAAIRHRALDSYHRADLLACLAIFGRLKNRGLDVLSLIGREELRDSTLFPEFLEEGQQIRARLDVLQALELRFGPEAAKEFTSAINRLENLEQLGELHKLAIQSRRISQFRKAFPKKPVDER